MRRDYVYVTCPFFYAVAEHIINTRSIDMKKRTGESFRHIAAHIPQQSASEIIATISPVRKELDILLSPQFLLFPHEGYPTFPVPLANIYGALLTSHHLYILCQNGVFHCFERETRNHEIAFLDDREIDFLSLSYELMQSLNLSDNGVKSYTDNECFQLSFLS